METLLLATGHYLWQFVEVAVLGFFVAGLIQAVIRPAALQRLVSGGVLRANSVAAVSGFATPLCCCTAIPTAIELYRSTGRRGPACAFLIATPWFNWYGLIALSLFLGWSVAIEVALSGVLIGLVTGILVDLSSHTSSIPTTDVAHAVTSCACGASCAAPSMDERWWDFSDPRKKLAQALRIAFDLLRELAPWILAGAVLGAVVKEFLPTGWVVDYGAATGTVSVLLLAMIASILYTDSLGSLPWIHALQSKGLASGNAMLLLVAGVGTNVATLGPVGRLMGRRAAAVYAMGVLVTAVLLALAMNHLL